MAALDRQHPRDLFDTKLLLENEGISPEIQRAFVVYLASHARPMHEVIKPTLHDKREEFEKEFVGMTSIPFSYSDYETTRANLIKYFLDKLTMEERNFLVSIQEGNPAWDQIGIPDIEQLPALKWKAQNVKQMDNAKRTQALQQLKSKLDI